MTAGIVKALYDEYWHWPTCRPYHDM